MSARFKHSIPLTYPVYRQFVDIPDDFAGKIIKLRFHGAQSHARVWVNGEFVREHRCGMTTWDCDITKLVIAGKKACLAVEVTDESKDPANVSRHCHRTVAGLIRNVELLALLQVHLTRLHVETDLDKTFKNARMLQVRWFSPLGTGKTARS